MSEHGADGKRADAPTGWRPWAVLLAGLAAWLAFDLAWPNVYGGTDVFHFKDAGCNLAAGRRFTSASFVGSESFEAKLWFSQGPLFPLVYGLYASLFGCGFASDNVFDLLVSAGLSAAVLALAGRGLRPRMRLAFAAALALVLPTGGLYWPNDRPDHAALALALLALLPVRSGGDAPVRPWIGPPLIAGLAFAASPFYGLVAFALAAAADLGRDGGSVRGAARRIAGGAIAFAAVPTAAVAVFIAYDPGTVGRFADHLSILFASGATFLERISHAVNSSGTNSRLIALRWLAALVFAAWLLAAAVRSGGARCRLWLPAALLALVAGVPVAFPHQNSYYAAAALIVAALMPGAVSGPAGGRARRLAATAILFLPLLPGLGTTLLQRLESHASYVEEARRVAARTYLAGRLAVVPSTHYFLFLPSGARLFDAAYLGPKHDPGQVDFHVVCRTAYPLGTALAPPPGFVPADPGAAPPAEVPMRLFGRTLMGRDWGWGCAVFRRPG
jgi:hypothetical protein